MIYTVTLNPSIDYVVEVNELTAGEIMRTKAEDLIFGGKGINVSSMLAQLGMKSCALGFIAGFTGDALEQGVAAMGIQPDFLKVEQGFTRINVKVHAQEESEINGQGPQIRYTHLEQLIKKLIFWCCPGMYPAVFHRISMRISCSICRGAASVYVWMQGRKH